MVWKAFVAAVFSLALLGCEEATVSNIPDQSASTATATEAAQSAEGIASALRSSGLPMTNIVAVTEATDSNGLLGRPNQYTSKAFFVDSRHTGEGIDPSEQNTIEVFATSADATKRREYIEAVTSEMPIFNQYIVQAGRVVLRLDKALTAAEAKEYEAALAAM